MSIVTTLSKVTWFFMPANREEAKAEFLTALRDPSPVYIICYGFTWEPMIEELLAAHATGVPIHIYLDHTQESGPSEKAQVKKLVDAGLDITVGTSPVSGAICHTKGFCIYDDPENPYCLFGSVNFSESGWVQENTMMTFRSKEIATSFKQQFDTLKSFAWVTEQRYQLYPVPVTISDVPVATITESVAVKETTTTITETIAPGEVPGKKEGV